MEELITARLLADVAVSGLVGTRIYPMRRQQNSALPALVLTRISGERQYDDEGAIGMVNARLQVDCWSEDYTGAKTLARAVRDSLGGYSGTNEGAGIHFVTLDGERDLDEGGSNQAEYLYRVSLDFQVWHSEGD